MSSDYPSQDWVAPAAPPDPPPQPAVPPPAPPGRSAWITTSAVILFVIAALSGLFGVIFLLVGLLLGPAFGELFGGMPGMPADGSVEAFGGVVTAVMVVFAVIALVWAGGNVAAGVGILGGRGWARITGMVLAVIGVLFGLLAIVGTITSAAQAEAMMSDPNFADMYAGMTPQDVATQSIVSGLAFTLPFVIGYAIVLVSLIRNGRFFDRTRSR